MYQTSSIRSVVTYGGQFLDSVSGVDVSCSVSYESSRSEVAFITGATLMGNNPGTSTVTLANSKSTAYAEVTVDSTELTVKNFEAMLPNLVQWSAITAPSAQIDYSINVKATLEQSLTAAGEGGPLYFMATLSDDSTQYVTKTMGVSAGISTEPCYNNDGVVTICSDSVRIVEDGDIINAYVAANAVSITTESAITAQWSNICNREIVYSGVGNVTISLSPVAAIFVNADTRYITDKDSNAKDAPASIATSIQLQVSVRYEDGSVVDFTNDVERPPSFSVSMGANIAEVSSSGEITVLSDGLKQGMFQVLVTIPGYTEAEGVRGSATFFAIDIADEGLKSELASWPAYSGAASLGSSAVLKTIQCTSNYTAVSLSTKIIYTDDSSIDISSFVEVKSSDTSIATVGLVDGKYVVYGQSIGVTTITTTFAGKSDSVTVNVSSEVLNVLSLDLITGFEADSTFTGVIKTETQLSAKIEFEDGTIIPSLAVRNFNCGCN